MIKSVDKDVTDVTGNQVLDDRWLVSRAGVSLVMLTFGMLSTLCESPGLAIGLFHDKSIHIR